ncbi:MAG: choice-of-anchor Q domain-containing protein [Planctomycetota bacterium]
MGTPEGDILKRFLAKWFSSRKNLRDASLPFEVEAVESRILLTSVTVNNVTDVVNGNTSSIAALLGDDGGDGISLREAIEATNAEAGGDEIQFDANLAGQTITLAGTQLAVSDSLQISAGDSITIDAASGSRVFAVTGSGDLTLTQLTLQNGSISGNGGGIEFSSSGTLMLQQSHVQNNRATGDGGGVFVGSGTLLITDSVISGNTAGGFATSGTDGGGVYSGSGDVTLTRSTVDGNLANGYGAGGGIYTVSGNLTVADSTVSRNRAYLGGGLFGDTATLEVTNSTLSGNIFERSGSKGGGIYANTNSKLYLRNSTVTDNEGRNTAGGSLASRGAGIFVNGEVTIENTIIAGNRSVNNTDIRLDANATLVTMTFSLIGSNQGTALVEAQTADANGNLIGGVGTEIDPRLTSLANFGGSTETHGLLVGSRASDAGDPAFDDGQLPHDQRGIGFDRVVGGRIDIGAFEGVPTGVVDAGDTIFIFGHANANDRVLFSQTPNRVQVTLNGARTDLTGTTATRLEVFTEGGADRVTIRTRDAMTIEVTSGADNDVIRVRNDGSTMVDGGDGNDNIRTGFGNDVLLGGAGNERLNGSRGDDLLRGGDDNDLLTGSLGNDILLGEGGEDRLIGGGDRDLLVGGLDADRLIGGGGDDILVGGQILQESSVANLQQIITGWTVDTDVQSRINTMQGALATILLPVMEFNRPQTVFDDGVADTLVARSTDWTFQVIGDDVLQGRSDFVNADRV